MVSYLACSDIHLGHKNTPTTHIVKNLIRFLCTEENKALDVIFIAGDIFDRLLDLNTDNTHSCLHFFNTLIRYCYNNEIKLRVLEGTPSHDWQQSKTLVKVNELKHNKCDLKYFTTLEIEYIADLHLHVLYIPDEWVNDHEELEKQVAAKLLEHNITQVDIAVLHGQFHYQTLGKPVKGFFFEEDYFLKIVKHFIHVGHYHTHSRYERIIAQGSFERLVHGEEGDKGYVRVKLPKKGKPEYEFVVNTNSYTYKTFKVTDKTTLAKLDKLIHALPEYSHVRLQMPTSCEFNPIFEALKQRWPHYHVKKLIKDKDTDKVQVNYLMEDTEIDFTNLGYSNSNILDGLYTVLSEKHQFDAVKMAKAKAYLEPYRSALV